MGALHKGHLALLERAKRENDIAVSSIFVNPLQFNDKADLEKYPRTLEKDAELLKSAGCDVIFVPSAEEMYPASAPSHLLGERGVDLGMLDKVMEGELRPGHFQGVCVVVKKLFDIVQPNKAYFGEKDFQQLAVIKHMVNALKIPVEIVPCATVREPDGLAMSSRNTLLSPDERKSAPLIYQTLQKIEEDWKAGRLQGGKRAAEKKINESPYFKLEYLEIVNSETLEPFTDYRSPAAALRACIAVKAGSIRLIDNIAL